MPTFHLGRTSVSKTTCIRELTIGLRRIFNPLDGLALSAGFIRRHMQTEDE